MSTGIIEPDERERRWDRAFDWPVLIAAGLVLPLLVVQSQVPTGALKTATDLLDYGIWAVFAVEVVVMLSITTDRKRWARTHWLDLLITIATPPFLIAALQPLQAARLLRFLRIVRLAPIIRKAFSPGGLKVAALVSAFSVAAGAILYFNFSGFDYGQSILVSGFAFLAGNTGPVKTPDAGSQVTTIVLRIVGIAAVAFFTGALAERFVRADLEEAAEAGAGDHDMQELMLAEIQALRSDVAEMKAALANQESRDDDLESSTV
jgi:voltage-gated potassium channel